jgi:hypothetical protein
MKIKQLTKKDIEIIVEALKEQASVRGNVIASGNDKYDKKVEDEILAKLENGNIWAWCTVKITCRYNGLESTEYLGCCSYEDEKDFIKNSGYYDDMVATCIADLQKQLNESNYKLN